MIKYSLSPNSGRSRRRREEGGALIVAVMVVAILAAGMGTYLSSLGTYRRLQEQRLQDDRALMAAEAGLAKQISALQGMATPPTADTSQVFALPAAQFAPFQNVTVAIHVQTSGVQQYWTLTATVVSAAAGNRSMPLARRVQATLTQQNFAKYELFINDYGGVWSPGYVNFIGAGSVFMGPVNINSGVAFFPNSWNLGEVTSAAPGGVRMFSDWSTYISGVYGKADANNYVNILQYWSSTYPYAPQFYGGLRMLSTPVSLPVDMNVDVRAKKLRDNAGLTLPDGYPGYVASAGPNFAVDLSNPTPGNSVITIKQYLGTVNGAPSYGPTQTKTVTGVNGAMIVKGNIVSLKGVLDGRLTIGVFKSPTAPDAGNVSLTGSLEYESRKNNANFQYTDAPGIFTADGAGINQTYVDTLQAQLGKLNDILGIVAEGNVMIKQQDLNGTAIANNVNQSIYIDAVVMTTGSSTSTPGGGGFGVEGDLTRPAGHAYFLGGMVENKQLNWALYDGAGIKNGIGMTQLWDKRAAQPGGAPPFFPSTGNFNVVPNSWTSGYVKDATTPAVYPSIN